MAQLTVRNLDDRVYLRLKDRAQRHHRSIEAETRAILEAATAVDRTEIARRTAEMREALKGRYSGDVTADVRRDRNR